MTANPLTAAAATTRRLARLAELITLAHGSGIPVPSTLQVHDLPQPDATRLTIGGVTFQATPDEYAAWCRFLEDAEQETHDLHGVTWHTARARYGDLAVEWYAPAELPAGHVVPSTIGAPA